ncbi:hypothetical protein DFH09DRAFT_1376433 [Mycena vulgaris]|nr:hypothetical protein DFH09DRAFT_1376433 [Mycena vulgaris]
MPSAGKGGVSLHSRLLHLQPFPPTRASASLACNAGVKGIMRKPRTTTTSTRSHARSRPTPSVVRGSNAHWWARSGEEEDRLGRALGFLMRESERHETNGTLSYILGVNFALTFYPIDIDIVAILMRVLLCSCSHISCHVPLVASETLPFSSPSSVSWTPFSFLS